MQFVAQGRVLVVPIHVRVIENLNGVRRVELSDGVTLKPIRRKRCMCYRRRDFPVSETTRPVRARTPATGSTRAAYLTI